MMLSDDVCLTSVCLSVTYIGPKSRTERPKKTKIGTEVAHVTRDANTTFQVKSSKVKVTRPLCSPRPYRMRQVQRWPWERIGRGKLLLRCVCSPAREALDRPRGRRWAGDISCRHAHSLLCLKWCNLHCNWVERIKASAESLAAAVLRSGEWVFSINPTIKQHWCGPGRAGCGCCCGCQVVAKWRCRREMCERPVHTYIRPVPIARSFI